MRLEWPFGSPALRRPGEKSKAFAGLDWSLDFSPIGLRSFGSVL